ncbi:MAG: hypothetical protein JWM95_3521 [Gemmatimonadetes bacterium]|nr:hypothetical protein [Gemmatimonadota bacterium]
MKTVLHVIDQGGPGGAQKVFVDLAAGLDRSDWHSIPVVPGPGWVADELRSRGLEPVFAPISGKGFDLRYLARLMSLTSGRRVDLVHTHLLGPAVYGSIAGLARSLPVVSTFHGQVDIAADERFSRAKFGILNRGACALVFVSDRLRQFYLSTTTLRADRAVVIHNGVNFRAPGATRVVNQPLRAELGVGPDDVLVGAIGHLRPAKAYDVFLHAAAELRRRSSRFRFVIVGLPEGTVLEELTALREQLGLADAMTFSGFRPDIRPVLDALDVYVITSSTEGFSLSLVEAMGQGVPTVATRCGGPEEIVANDVTGLLVPVGDPEAISEAIAYLTSHPEVSSRIASSAEHSVRERFSMQQMLSSYSDLYAGCLNTRSGPWGNS